MRPGTKSEILAGQILLPALVPGPDFNSGLKGAAVSVPATFKAPYFLYTLIFYINAKISLFIQKIV